MSLTPDKWPRLFKPLSDQLRSSNGRVVVAERWTNNSANHSCHRVLAMGLADLHEYDAVSTGDELGFWPTSSGPRPAYRYSSTPYRPRFWIHGGRTIPDDIEPLVLSWEANNQTVLQVDPGILMTYGLIPRYSPDGTVVWDDVALPQRAIVTQRPIAHWDFPDESRADIVIERDYLQDYSSLRQKAVIAVFLEEHWIDEDGELEEVLKDTDDLSLSGPTAALRVHRVQTSRGRLRAELTGHALVLVPGKLPITVDREDYGALSWPGVEQPVTQKSSGDPQLPPCVYVRDTVLAQYEGYSEYDVSPETGGVSLGGQWGVVTWGRFSRDLIQVDLKKLYEGVPPHVTRHWHAHSTDRPVGEIDDLRRVRNVAMRAKEITYGMVAIADSICAVVSILLGRACCDYDVCRLSRAELDYDGWWKEADIERIARHLPQPLSRDGFMQRCKDLFKVTGERLNPGLLRECARVVGLDEAGSENWGSIKLLNWIVSAATIAKEQGLPLRANAGALRSHGFPAVPPCARLFALNQLRQLDAHSQGGEAATKFEGALQAFAMNVGTGEPDYSLVCDAVYDGVIEVLVTSAVLLADVAAEERRYH